MMQHRLWYPRLLLVYVLDGSRDIMRVRQVPQRILSWELSENRVRVE